MGSCRGLQTGHPGSYSKKQIFGPRTENFRRKNVTLLNSNHVPATTGQCYPNKKVPFSQMINRDLPFWGVYIAKNGVLPCIPFSAQQTNGRFSVIRTRTDPVSLISDQNQGYFPFLGGNRQKWPKFGPVAGKRPAKPQKMGVKWVKGEKEE